MRIRRKLRRSLAAVIALAAVPLLAPAAFAEIVGVELQEWQQAMSGELRGDGETLDGTTVDLQDTLNLEEKDYVTGGRLWLHWPKKNYLLYNYFDSSRSGEAVLSDPLIFDDTPFAPGETVKSRMGVKLESLLYAYRFLDLKIVNMAFALGADRLSLDARLESATTGTTAAVDDRATIPAVGLSFAAQPVPFFRVSAEAQGMRYHGGGGEYRFYDERAQVEFHFIPFFGLNVGYRKVRVDAESDDFGEADFTQRGPFATLQFRF
jgi:hypothetical protein